MVRFVFVRISLCTDRGLLSVMGEMENMDGSWMGLCAGIRPVGPATASIFKTPVRCNQTVVYRESKVLEGGGSVPDKLTCSGPSTSKGKRDDW